MAGSRCCSDFMDLREFLSENTKVGLYLLFASLLILSILFANPFLVAICALSLLLAVVYSGSAHVLNPIIARKYGINVVQNGYRLSENLKVAIKGIESGQKAVCISLLIPSSRITGESEKLEEIISKTRFPFEFSLQIKELEPKKIIEAYETKRRMKEIEISRTSPSKPEEISRLKRELEIIEGELAQITKGTIPTKASMKLKTYATGHSESEAANIALGRMDTLCTLFSTTYNLSAKALLGEALLLELGE